MNQERERELKEMLFRVVRIREFCNEALLKKPTDDDFNRFRAHCKGLHEAARSFLLAEQPDWYKLSQRQRDEAAEEAFKKIRKL